jgi:hypothetical protein
MGDRASVRRYAALHLTHNASTSYQTEAVRWLGAVMRGDGVGLAAQRAQIDRMHRFSLRSLVEWAPAMGLGLEDADTAAHAFARDATTVDERRAAVVALVPYLLNRGRPGAASRLLATAERGLGLRADVGVLELRVYAGLFWDGDSSEAATAARALEAYLDGAPTPQGHVRTAETARCAIAHWHVARGNFSAAEAALARIGPPTVESTPTCVAAARARLAAARQSPHAATALAQLDSLLTAGTEARHLLPGVAALIAAQLHATRGELPQALGYARRRIIWTNQLLATQLREEGRIAALLGDSAAAMRAYVHYLALRSDPEPALTPEVARVQAELRRLGRSSSNQR